MNMQRKIFLRSGQILSLVIFLLTASNMSAGSDDLSAILADLPIEAPVVAVSQFPVKEVNVVDFGAIGDGHTLNTVALQKAIDACAAAGGGQVTIPAGIWFTSSLELRSRINVHLQDGAFLLFDGYNEKYPLVEFVWDGVGRYRCRAPLFGYRLENVAITGSGIIDGSGHLWRPVKKFKMTGDQWQELISSGGALESDGKMWWPSANALSGVDFILNLEKSGRPITSEDYRGAAEYLRPVLVDFVECKNVLLDGPTFQNSPGWNIHPLLCENVIIRNVKVRNPWYSQNGDGLDLESTRNAVVYNSSFDVGDDAICIKSGKNAAGRLRGRPTENVVIQNCTVYHGHGGFTIGSEMSGGVRNILVRHCTFIGTDVGLRFKTTRGRGGVVENIYIQDILMKDIPTDAIGFNMYYTGNAPIPENGQTITKPVEVIPPVSEETPRFQKIFINRILCKGAAQAVQIQGLPELPIDQVELKDIFISAKKGLICEDATKIKLVNVKIETEKGPVFSFNNCQNVFIQKPEFKDNRAALILLEGSKTKEIEFSEVNFYKIKEKIILGKNVPPDALIEKR